MKKEFLPYDLEVKLVELGFKEKTFDVHSDGWTRGFKVVKKPTPRIIFQQAFRFFREKYDFVSEINVYSTSDGYSFSFKILCKKYTPYIEANNAWILYEDAQLACIRKLIEIAKEQNVK